MNNPVLSQTRPKPMDNIMGKTALPGEVSGDPDRTPQVPVPMTADPGTSKPVSRKGAEARLLSFSSSIQHEGRFVSSEKLDNKKRSGYFSRQLSVQYALPSVWTFKGTAGDKILACVLWLKKRGTGKQVKAGKDVLSMYHDSFLYAEVPLSTKLRTAIHGGHLRTLLLWLEFIAAFFSVVVYIRSTYTYETPPYLIVVETVCGVFFLVDYFMNWFSAPVRLYYIISPTGIVDLLCLLPIALIWRSAFHILVITYGNVVLVEYMLTRFTVPVGRIAPMLTSIGVSGATIAQQIIRLVVYVFGVILIAAGLVQWIDFRAISSEYKEKHHCSPKGCMTFFEAFYFMIVTISTVGFGDVTVHSDWGRAVVILTIVVALVILPAQINKILQLASRRPYGGSFALNKVLGSRFIIMSGNLTFRTVQDFLSEFYHPSHDKDLAAFPIRVVLLAPYRPSFELKTLLARYNGLVEFIQGTPLKDSDLDRVSANVASAFFLIADQHAQDPEAEDATQILRTLAVHRQCGSPLRIIVELLKPERQTNAIWDDATSGIEIICFESIRFKLLSRRQGLPLSKPEKGSWLRQYYHGLRQQVYPVLLPSCFFEEELLFEEAAEIIYERMGVILFGLDIVSKEPPGREVVLFPKGHVIRQRDVGLAIAKNLEDAESVSKFGKNNKLCQKIKRSPCTSCLNHSNLSDQDFVNLVKSKRFNLTQYTNIEKSAGSYKDLTQERQLSSLTQGFLDSVSNLQSRFGTFLSPGPSNAADTTTLGEVLAPRESGHMSSLKQAIDMAMSWPPSDKQRKPVPPVLERRATDILAHLEKLTLSLVNLSEPHILLCIQGPWPSNLFYFISHSRTLLPKSTPIVILHPFQPTAVDWGCVGMFEGVYYIRGSPIYELDLVRAGVLQAVKVVILTSCAQVKKNGMSAAVAEDEARGVPDSSAYTQDVHNIVIAATVERLCPARERIIVELQQETTLQYLRPKLYIDRRQFSPYLYRRNRVGIFQFAPPYIQGKAFCPQTLAFLTYATFFNRSCFSIVDQLISGGKVLSPDGDRIEDGLRILDQIILPTEFGGQTYGTLFGEMLRKHGMLALGLYRESHGSPVPYVFTNPGPHERLELNDLVYVLR
ncbi:hypothetical protein R1sor_027527 [Riccia sorocarpa]|uniref:Uncharacterized protein n=1 Tax=Riccia sorocarpa TaxID=122646 RepID=A0ABD3GGK3_9MARC